MVFAEWHVWPNDAPSLGFFTPYTYMCTDCAIEAIRNGMVQVALKTERDPHDIVRVGQIKRIPLLDRKNDE
jgi:hypothetical protein